MNNFGQTAEIKQRKNKWLIVLAAIGLHISIGSVYAWSVVTRPIMQSMDITLQQVTWAFSIAILFLGTSAGFLGTYVERLGPRKSGLIATLFYVIGMVGTGYAISVQSLSLLYLFYGVIGGIGLGVGYITPVSTLVKWFPNNRGLATGLAIMGFGFASLVAGPAMQYFIATYGLVQNFVIMGAVYAIIMVSSSLYIEPPIAVPVKAMKQYEMAAPSQKQYTVQEAVRTWQFYALWFLFFINITCGIGLLAVASPMAQEVIGMTPMQAASMVGVIGILNGGGRIAWSTISDYIGRRNVYPLFFAIEIVAFYFLADVKSSFLFQLLIFIIVTCYGGGFSCMPAYLSDLYGVKQLSAIHGRVLTAWGLAGIAGPLLLSTLHEMMNSYSFTLYVFSGLFVVNLVVALFLKYKTSRETQALAAQIHD